MLRNAGANSGLQYITNRIPQYRQANKEKNMNQTKDIDDRNSVLEAERKRIDAYINCDKQILDRIMSDDFYYVNSRGKIVTKNQLISALQNRVVTFESIELDDVNVRIFDNTAIITGKLHEVGKSGDESFNEEFRFTRIYLRQNGNEWRSVAYHSSKIVDE